MSVTAKKERAGATGSRETAGQIASRYGVSRRKVIDWYHGGLIPAVVHIGRVLRFDPAEVEAALRKASGIQ